MATAAELIAAIVADPDDHHARLVYADWLIDRGDPRGELVRADKKAFERLHDEDLLSPALRAQAKYWQLEWDRGFIQRADLQTYVHGATAETVRALCSDPHAGLVEWLEIAYGHTRTFDPDDGPHPHVMDWHRATYDFGDLTTLFSRLRHLEHLELSGVRVDRLEHANLRTLVTDGMRDLVLPKLETLRWSGDASIFGKTLPSLRTLSLEAAPGPADIARLARSQLTRQLRTLWLAAIDVTTLLSLRDYARMFGSLEKIGLLTIRNGRVPAQLRDELADALPNTRLLVRWELLTGRAIS